MNKKTVSIEATPMEALAAESILEYLWRPDVAKIIYSNEREALISSGIKASSVDAVLAKALLNADRRAAMIEAFKKAHPEDVAPRVPIIGDVPLGFGHVARADNFQALRSVLRQRDRAADMTRAQAAGAKAISPTPNPRSTSVSRANGNAR